MTATEKVRSRPTSLILLALVALVAALLATTMTGDRAASADSGPDHASREAHGHGAVAARSMRASEVVFHDAMRKLWEDHVTWTRLAIVTFADGSESFDATAGRLLQNQTDIGNAIKPFYGEAAGNQLTALLNDHINIAVELLVAAKNGDAAAVQDASDRWYANANDIADFLAAANPRFWPQHAMRGAMKTHLDQTLAEATHELTGDYAASVADYDEIHAHILAMADTLSEGVIKAFPKSFR